jgi:hypothetical protein
MKKAKEMVGAREPWIKMSNGKDRTDAWRQIELVGVIPD